MAEFIEKITSQVQKYLDILDTPIYGRPITSWFKLLLLYSFVIWVAIIVWRGLSFYQEYQKLEEKKISKEKQLRRMKLSIVQYKRKIKTINLAYREISKIFSPEKVKQLQQKLDKLVEEINAKRNITKIYPLNPYRFTTFNYPVGLNRFLSNFKTVTVEGVNFSATSIYEYRNILQKLYSVYQDSKNGTYSGKVKVTFTDDKIGLFFVKGEGLLTVDKILLKGLISDAEALPYYPTATYFYKTSGKVSNISQVYFGWDLSIKSEGFEK